MSSIRRNPGTAVVIGGSMAGLVAARVLADHFEQVALLERDLYPLEQPDFRRGVPQGFHVHLVLARGRELLMELFPDLDATLATAGAPSFDLLETGRLCCAAGSFPNGVSNCVVRAASRILLEFEVRRRVAAVPNVKILSNADVTGLVVTPDGARAAGVLVKARREGHGDVPARVGAALIVDASGRGSKAPRWLKTVGYPEPPTTHVNSHLSYATRWYRGVELENFSLLAVGPRAPTIPRSGTVIPIEGNRFMVMFANIGLEPAPTDDAGFLEFSKALAYPYIYDAIKNAEPLGPARSYRGTGNQWRDYAALDRLLEGFVPIGDALCAFNPFYGQGITVAALEARILGEETAKGIDGLARRCQNRFRKIVKDAWALATSEDYRWPTTEGPPVGPAIRLGHAYTDRVLEVAVMNVNVAATFGRVLHMKAPATALFRPHVLLPVLARLLTCKRSTRL
jgi:2-polyprenyl-6-methoxyphenol hydroxylase-like FAD-dependent oxidoreductase